MTDSRDAEPVAYSTGRIHPLHTTLPGVRERVVAEPTTSSPHWSSIRPMYGSEIRAQLDKLHLERLQSEAAGLGQNEAYMARLNG